MRLHDVSQLELLRWKAGWKRVWVHHNQVSREKPGKVLPLPRQNPTRGAEAGQGSKAMTAVHLPPPPPNDGHFAVLYFAAASTFTGRRVDALPAPLPLARLFPALERRYPGFAAAVLRHCAVTVNLRYVDVPLAAEGEGVMTVIGEGDEVAIIPPVSSG
ncbi:hypothetical protein P8C59_004968 [Phyllachora maydis]|uniref:Molybdopterin synthase sulfur carrier subunit n=1 Tax=Phyllachora maydis TaxID=1825666 RepID=A0AAD9I4K9_9PEZI|nr:hypothetical protein P8C59_004968 [Phyllachora maydis]